MIASVLWPLGQRVDSAGLVATSREKVALREGCPAATGHTKWACMQRRKTIALSPEEQQRFLEGSHTIILTSNDRQGYPHSVAMWYVADPDGTVAMTTFAKAQKAMNLRRDPRCALLVESGRTYPELKGLLIRGRASLDPDTEHVLDVLQQVHAKYNTPGPTEGLRDAMRGQARKRVVIRVHPERVSSWDHAKLGGNY